MLTKYPLLSHACPDMAASLLDWSQQEYNQDLIGDFKLILRPVPGSVLVDVMVDGHCISHPEVQPLRAAAQAFYAGWNRHQIFRSEQIIAQLEAGRHG